VVERIFVINMVRYEISDFLLSNSKSMIFKLGIALPTVCESETSAIDVEIRHVSQIHYMCDQSLLHTRSAKKKRVRLTTTSHIVLSY